MRASQGGFAAPTERPHMTPTPEQEAIISAVTVGHNTMVTAFAGCAKTTSLELAVRARKVHTGLVAFNVKIKKELENRLSDFPLAHVTTLNGLGHKALLRSRMSPIVKKEKLFLLGKDLGLRKDDLANAIALAKLARQRGVIPKGRAGRSLLPDTDETWLALAIEEDCELPLAAAARTILTQSYDKALKEGLIDFDDQIYLSALVFNAMPCYDTLMVDEAQDLSPLNHLQVAKACSSRRQLVAVGDPNQAIYAFRGADHASMTNLRELRAEWSDQTLSVTFRCPKSVVARQAVDGFAAHDSAPEGRVEAPASWWPEPQSAILCRNNAPLIRLAFRLLRQGTPVTLLGTDIGRALRALYKKLSAKKDWRAAGEALCEADPAKRDRFDSLCAVLDGAPSIDEGLRRLSTSREGAVTLATGHRAKGLEWSTVYHLEPQLIPSFHATTEAELQQEANLRYVIETRTKHDLFLVSSKGLRNGQA